MLPPPADPVVQPPELVQLEFEQEVYSVSESLSQVVACLSPVNPQDLVAPISANAFTASSDATRKFLADYVHASKDACMFIIRCLVHDCMCG